MIDFTINKAVLESNIREARKHNIILPTIAQLKDPETIRMGLIRTHITYTLYFTAGVMEAISGSLRGLGYSTSSMIVTVTGICGLRLAWVLMVFPHFRSLACLYFSYPLSWGLVAVMNGILLWCVCRKLRRPAMPAR